MEMAEDKVRKLLKIAKEPISMETPIGDGEDSNLGDFIEDTAAEHARLGDCRVAARNRARRAEPAHAARGQGAAHAGIDLSTDHTLEKVGKQFDVTRERIRQVEAKALRKLRHPSRSEQLRSFLSED
jgi:RNA polymerase primary sigma factor